MKRRAFLQGALAAPIAATAGINPEHPVEESGDVVKFSDEDGSVTFDFTDKEIRAKGEPVFWNIYIQLVDYLDEHEQLDTEQPMQHIAGDSTGLVLAYVNEDWSHQGLAQIRKVAFNGFTTFHFLIHNVNDPEARLYLNKQQVYPDRDGKLSIENGMMALYRDPSKDSVTATKSRPGSLDQFTQNIVPEDRITVFPV